MQINRQVVIWGNDNYNLLGVLRQLVPFDVNVFVVFNEKTNRCASSSKYCKEFAIVKKHEAIKYLLSRYKGNHPKPVLITTSDEMASLIDLNKNILEEVFVLSGTKKMGVLSVVQNKNEMAKIANSCGFEVPQYRALMCNMVLPTISYPCFIRPALKHNSTFKNSVKINTPTELSLIQRELSLEDELIVTDYIPKERDLLVIGVRLHNGTVYIPGCFIKDRWDGGESGTGSHGIISANIPSYVNISAIHDFLSVIEYFGPFSFEFGIWNDIAYFYEVNLRNDGTSDYFSQCGSNTVLVWVADCCGLDVSNIAVPVQREAMMINEIVDYENVKRGIVTLSEWKKQRNEASVYVYFNKNDIKPYLLMKQKQWNIHRLLQRILNKTKKMLNFK